LVGLFAGALIGAAVVGAAWLVGANLAAGEVEETAAIQAVRAQKTEADNRARQSEVGRQAAEAARAKIVKALDVSKQETAAALKQKNDAEQRLHGALAHLAKEQELRAALEKARTEEAKPKSVPTLSFVRDWQLLGPFAGKGEQTHDTVYPPEREPVQLQKAYDGSGGPVHWQPYHSGQDKIDLASFFNYRLAGAAYAVSWVYSDNEQAVTVGVGSDDGVCLWVNGQKLLDVKGGRQARPGQDIVRTDLKKGWNQILAKVDNIIGTWELYLEFRTADGRQPLKIVSANTPPPTAAP
jgi:hypothetical protein